jgi:uncharacterized protein with beta-barrel porin domain
MKNSTSVWKKTFIQGLLLVAGFHAGIVFACCNIDDEPSDELINELGRSITSLYNRLNVTSQGGGRCADDALVGSAGCDGDVFKTWQIIRALVHTSNELEAVGGPTQFSLGIGGDGLVEALRWNAGEEFSSHENLSSGFSNNQLSNLVSRIAALRGGASGFSVNGFHSSQEAVAKNNNSLSGLNSGDEAWSQWGGFLNASYSTGNLDPSARSDAFDFDGNEVNGGLDYRINNNWTLGALLAYATQDADFDSSKSVVDGTVKMKALSISPFVLYQSDKWFYAASLGYQTSEFDTNRSVRFTSSNLSFPSPNTVAVSNNDGSTLSTSISGGYSFALTDKLTLEPSLAINHQSTTIDEFTEQDKNNSGFNLLVREQKFKSLETIFGAKTQYVFSTGIGVFMPYVDLQAVIQHEDEPRKIRAIYANIASLVSEDAEIKLLTDNPDSSYGTFSVGVASVLRGASQKEYGSAASGGIQAFVNLRTYIATDLYSQSTFTAGVRYEF